MAILIKLEKRFEEKNIYYYTIETEAAGGYKGIVAIDSSNKEIAFLDENFKLLKKISRHSNDPVGSVPGMPQAVLACIIIQTAKALDKNEFPNHLDYAA